MGILSPLIALGLVIGFIAGLTLEAFFARLQKTNVPDTKPAQV